MFGPGEQTFLEYLGNEQADSGPIRDFFRLPLPSYFQKWVLGKTNLFVLFFFAESGLILLYIGFSVSVWKLLRTKAFPWRSHGVIWVVMLYFIVTSGGYSRFRIPIMPFLAIYAGQGLSHIATALTRRKI